MTANDSTSSERNQVKSAGDIADLLETARRQFRAGHYGIALTALEQAVKKVPADETIDVAVAYLRTNMVALKARDAGMPVQTPDPPPFFDAHLESNADDVQSGGFATSSTMELDAELPFVEKEAAEKVSEPKEEQQFGEETSSVILEAMVPDESRDQDETLPGFEEQKEEESDQRSGSSMELEALPPQESEEIELESFAEDQAEEKRSASPGLMVSTREEESDDLFSQEDLDLLASDDESVGALATEGPPAARGRSQESEIGRSETSDGFPEDEPTIARTADQAVMPSAFGKAVAHATEKKSATKELARDSQANVVFGSSPSKAPMEPSSMTISGMPLPDFLQDESRTGQNQREETTDGKETLEEEETMARDHAPAESDSFDDVPTMARDHAPAESDSFDDVPTMARDHAPAESDSFDEAPTIARDGLHRGTTDFTEHGPTGMRNVVSPSSKRQDSENDWSLSAEESSSASGQSHHDKEETESASSAPPSPLLPADKDSLSLDKSEMPPTLGFSDDPTMERDTWRRKDNQGRPRPQDLLNEAKELFDQGEHTKSLELCLRVAPVLEGDSDLERLIQENEEILANRYVVQLGGLDAVPIVTFDGQDLQALGMDHRKAFLLTRIDGSLTVDEILMISGMSRLETARMLMELRLAGLIDLEPPEDQD